MPLKPSRRTSQSELEDWTGFLDRGVRIEGTVEMEGTFRVEGWVKGKIISQHVLFLGEGAEVEGQIEGNRVVIAGRFDGVIFAKGRVEIHTKGVVTGEVHSPCLIIEPGGVLDGRYHMVSAAEAGANAALAIPIRAAGR